MAHGAGAGLRHADGVSRRWERLGLRYAVAIRGGLTCTVPDGPPKQTAVALSDAAPADAWQSVTWGAGTTGALTASFYAVRARPAKGRGTGGAVRALSDDGRKSYLLNLDPTVSVQALVTLARARWLIEQQYRELRDDLGLDHFEGRRYRGRGITSC